MAPRGMLGDEFATPMRPWRSYQSDAAQLTPQRGRSGPKVYKSLPIEADARWKQTREQHTNVLHNVWTEVRHRQRELDTYTDALLQASRHSRHCSEALLDGPSAATGLLQEGPNAPARSRSTPAFAPAPRGMPSPAPRGMSSPRPVHEYSTLRCGSPTSPAPRGYPSPLAYSPYGTRSPLMSYQPIPEERNFSRSPSTDMGYRHSPYPPHLAEEAYVPAPYPARSRGVVTPREQAGNVSGGQLLASASALLSQVEALQKPQRMQSAPLRHHSPPATLAHARPLYSPSSFSPIPHARVASSRQAPIPAKARVTSGVKGTIRPTGLIHSPRSAQAGASPRAQSAEPWNIDDTQANADCPYQRSLDSNIGELRAREDQVSWLHARLTAAEADAEHQRMLTTRLAAAAAERRALSAEALATERQTQAAKARAEEAEATQTAALTAQEAQAARQAMETSQKVQANKARTFAAKAEAEAKLKAEKDKLEAAQKAQEEADRLAKQAREEADRAKAQEEADLAEKAPEQNDARLRLPSEDATPMAYSPSHCVMPTPVGFPRSSKDREEEDPMTPEKKKQPTAEAQSVEKATKVGEKIAPVVAKIEEKVAKEAEANKAVQDVAAEAAKVAQEVAKKAEEAAKQSAQRETARRSIREATEAAIRAEVRAEEEISRREALRAADSAQSQSAQSAMQAAVAAAQTAEAASNALRTEVVAMGGRLTTLEHELKERDVASDALKAEVTSLGSRLAKAEVELKERDALLAAAEERATALAEEASRATAALQAKDTELTSLKAEMGSVAEKATQKLRAELEAKSAAEAKVKAEVQALQEESDEMREQVTALQQQLEKAKAELAKQNAEVMEQAKKLGSSDREIVYQLHTSKKSDQQIADKNNMTLATVQRHIVWHLHKMNKSIKEIMKETKLDQDAVERYMVYQSHLDGHSCKEIATELVMSEPDVELKLVGHMHKGEKMVMDDIVARTGFEEQHCEALMVQHLSSLKSTRTTKAIAKDTGLDKDTADRHIIAQLHNAKKTPKQIMKEASVDKDTFERLLCYHMHLAKKTAKEIQADFASMPHVLTVYQVQGHIIYQMHHHKKSMRECADECDLTEDQCQRMLVHHLHEMKVPMKEIYHRGEAYPSRTPWPAELVERQLAAALHIEEKLNHKKVVHECALKDEQHAIRHLAYHFHLHGMSIADISVEVNKWDKGAHEGAQDQVERLLAYQLCFILKETAEDAAKKLKLSADHVERTLIHHLHTLGNKIGEKGDHTIKHQIDAEIKKDLIEEIVIERQLVGALWALKKTVKQIHNETHLDKHNVERLVVAHLHSQGVKPDHISEQVGKEVSEVERMLCYQTHLMGEIHKPRPLTANEALKEMKAVTGHTEDHCERLLVFHMHTLKKPEKDIQKETGLTADEIHRHLCYELHLKNEKIKKIKDEVGISKEEAARHVAYKLLLTGKKVPQIHEEVDPAKYEMNEIQRLLVCQLHSHTQPPKTIDEICEMLGAQEIHIQSMVAEEDRKNAQPKKRLSLFGSKPAAPSNATESSPDTSPAPPKTRRSLFNPLGRSATPVEAPPSPVSPAASTDSVPSPAPKVRRSLFNPMGKAPKAANAPPSPIPEPAALASSSMPAPHKPTSMEEALEAAAKSAPTITVEAPKGTPYVVEGAGSDQCNGTYLLVGNDANGRPKYQASHDDVWTLMVGKTGQWEISEAGHAEYHTTTAGATPPADGWATSAGSAPLPKVRAAPELEGKVQAKSPTAESAVTSPPASPAASSPGARKSVSLGKRVTAMSARAKAEAKMAAQKQAQEQGAGNLPASPE